MIDLTGRTFGRLKVIRFDHKNPRYQSYWLCQCSCGNRKTIRIDALVEGRTTSCGCFNREVAAKRGKKSLYKHGGYGTSLYKRWIGMRNRCNDPNAAAWRLYGGRGIRVCDEWNESFESFREWAIANGYREDAKKGECTIDRIDPNGNYEPSNCRWISIFEQQSNKRNNRFVEFRGNRYTLAQLARKVGMNATTLSEKLNRGMSVEEAVA